MDSVTIGTLEYKDLILKEKELEEVKKKMKQQEEVEDELEELILIIVGNKTSFHEKIEHFNIQSHEIEEYLNKYYFDNGLLKFRKQKIKQEEIIQNKDQEDVM